ncbi:MAG: Na(+)/H(+) antiporter NhaD [Chlamydiae bacterium]|nr:Na(+)/H(+) antiporter NhaD [Chlamydiota bacterium]
MESSALLYSLILSVFILGYVAIILEYTLKVNKTAVALLIAALCWAIYFMCSSAPVSSDLHKLGEHLNDVSQIIFFLMGAMTLVELIDSHKGFKIVTDLIHTTSKRKMLWIVAVISFCLSAVLDNLTTTILMVSLLRKMIPMRKERFLLSCIVIVAANAGGAWTPIGDVTTTMLWINGQLSSLSVMKALILPSLVALLVPMCYFSFREKGVYADLPEENADALPEPGARLVFFMGLGALIFVPVFKTVTGLPPFMGVLFGLSALWLVTDLLHHKYEHRQHLRVPTILTKIDTSGVLFFLGILLCINSLETAGLLTYVAEWLETTIKSQELIATLIGMFSAIIDNVPLVAATMGMYPLTEFPIDSSLWHMIAYAAGTGGSMLLIGSSAGVALMGLEKIDFFSYMRKMTIPVFIGYLAGMGTYILQLWLFSS